MTVTVGRVVHFHSEHVAANGNQLRPGAGYNGAGAGPYLAFVTQIVGGYANLYVIPPFGDPFHEGSVPEKGSIYDDGRRYWEFPPKV